MLKRLFDIFVSLPLLVLLSPLILGIAVLIRVTMGPPVLFRQVRPGLHGKPFEILKFRTMTDARDLAGNPLPDSERLTRLGRFLRSTSLDELPELLNVLKGDMSLVGPRPLLMKYMPYFTPRERIRFSMRPGMTGLAQVMGRNALTWDERLEFDVQYVENWSFKLDLKILWWTLVAVFRRSGVEVDPRSKMPDLDDERRRRWDKEGDVNGA